MSKCLIVILDRCLGGGRMLAEQPSERLGYRFIDESTVIEMAAARGGSYRDIRAFLEKPPVGFVSDASVSRYYLCLALLRAALAEEAVGGDAVYCGDAGYLLPKGPLSPVLRIQASAPTEVRIAAARQHLALTEAEAKTYIRQADRRQQAWVRHVTGVGDEDPSLYDLVIDLQHMDTRVACLGIAAFVQQQTSREPARQSQLAIVEFAVASRALAELALNPATAYLRMKVEPDGRLAFASEGRWGGHLNAARSRVLNLRRLSHLVPARKWAYWWPWRSAAATGGLMVLGFLLVRGFAPTERTQTVVGIITDTQCAGDHHVSPASAPGQCVKKYVHLGANVRYALFDGNHLYTLTDQRIPEAFAGAHVKVTGVVDQKTKVLHMRCIEPTS